MGSCAHKVPTTLGGRRVEGQNHGMLSEYYVPSFFFETAMKKSYLHMKQNAFKWIDE